VIEAQRSGRRVARWAGSWASSPADFPTSCNPRALARLARQHRTRNSHCLDLRRAEGPPPPHFRVHSRFSLFQ
jgi:hypothetical protein